MSSQKEILYYRELNIQAEECFFVSAARVLDQIASRTLRQMS